MMADDADLDEHIRSVLDRMTPMHRATFAAVCAERLFPRYVAFSEGTGEGDALALRKSLDKLWSHVSGASPVRDVGAEVRRCTTLVPSEEGPERFRSEAEDACVAVACAWEATTGSDGLEASWAADRVLDSLLEHVRRERQLEPSGKRAASSELERPLVSAERLRQLRDLEALESVRSPSSLATLQARAQREAKGLFDPRAAATYLASCSEPRSTPDLPKSDARDWPDQLDARLGTMSVRARAAFAAACAERAMPRYVELCGKSSDGAPAAARASLDRLWNQLADSDHTLDASAELAACQDLFSAGEDAGDRVPAGDAWASLAYAWESIATGEQKAAAYAGGGLIDALYEHVVESMGLRPGDRRASVWRHEVIEAEVARQRRDLETLESDFDHETIAVLRRRASREASELFD
ncbi:MAG: YjaG family protein [bacterium]|nr:YjaG family protein [bacterium]